MRHVLVVQDGNIKIVAGESKNRTKSKQLNLSKSTALSRANFADALHFDRNTAPSIRNITVWKFLMVDVKINARFAISLADTDEV